MSLKDKWDWYWYDRRLKKGEIRACTPVCCPPEQTAMIVGLTPSDEFVPPVMNLDDRWEGWDQIDYTPGPQGVAVAEALGLDPKAILGEPIRFLRGRDKVWINYTGCTTVTPEQLDEALYALLHAKIEEEADE